MSGAQGNALDWALALAKAPSERHALRQRALPDELDILMQIAGGGAGDTLARAVVRTGESPRSNSAPCAPIPPGSNQAAGGAPSPTRHTEV